MRPSARVPFAVLCAAAALCGCPRSKSPPDAGPADAGRDAGPGAADAGSDAGVDSGFTCRIDDDCAALMAGLRCGDDAGCIPATGCQLDSNCTTFDPSNYCFDPQCRCVTEANDSGFPGVCRRRRPVCAVCTDDSQCGHGSAFNPDAVCKLLAGDTSGNKYCFQQKNGPTCGCGMIDDGTGFCRPQGNSCNPNGCRGDGDCGGGQVCNLSSCLCETRCRWDFAAQKDSPDCPPGTICWVDSANLAPSSVFYGAGRCRAPCVDDAGCSDPAQDPFGGQNLKCAPEKVGTGFSPNRCRANGECMDNLECPVLPPNQPDLGYCDRGTFTCRTDCRTGLDPSTGLPYADCRPGFSCQVDAGMNVCAQRTCIDLGGALLACSRGQYCCGEDLEGNGQPPACVTDAGLGPDRCYDSAQPPFCTPCMTDADCQGLPNPNGSILPTLCVAAGYSMTATTKAVCAPGTYNDATPDSLGVPRYLHGCPNGYVVRMARPLDMDPTYGGTQDTCAVSSDCNLGTDAGVCGPDPFHQSIDGGRPLTCLCNAPGQTTGCPNDPASGVASVCSKMSAATPQICITSIVCMPGRWMYQDAGPPSFGCGLQ